VPKLWKRIWSGAANIAAYARARPRPRRSDWFRCQIITAAAAAAAAGGLSSSSSARIITRALIIAAGGAVTSARSTCCSPACLPLQEHWLHWASSFLGSAASGAAVWGLAWRSPGICDRRSVRCVQLGMEQYRQRRRRSKERLRAKVD